VTGPLGLVVLAFALSGVTEVRGVYRERFYTGACDREGVAGWQDRPVGGKRLFVRVAGDAPAPALAEVVTAPDGTFAMSFRPPAAGEYCIAHQGKERLVCLTSFGATIFEGAVSTNVVIGPVNPRPGCVSQRRRVRGQTRFVEEPCGDRGKPPRTIGGKRVWLHSLDVAGADVAVTSDPQGRFEASLLPGRYCARLQPGGDDEGCVARFEMAGRDVDGAVVDFTRSCGGAPKAARQPGQAGEEALPARARGVGRVAALDGTLHVRGQVVHQTTYWGGAYRREPPPVVTAGNALRVRRGERNGPHPLVAEVITDEEGFDVALPPGVWCFETTYHDQWFKDWARPSDGEFDRACLKSKYETCDFVARLAASDIEGVRISTTQWHPPSAPCRSRPYTGSSPP
jgi:hypothetical protein